MFNEIYDIEGILKSLELERILFAHDKEHTGSILDSDYYYTNTYEVMTVNFDAEVVGLADTDSIIYKFYFPELSSFYTLCKEHSRREKINFKKDPYVKAAEKFVTDAFHSSGADNFAWNLWVPPKLIKKRAYTVIVETGTYFDSYIEIIETLYEIREYYTRQCEILREELYGTKAEVLKMPITSTSERKAA